MISRYTIACGVRVSTHAPSGREIHNTGDAVLYLSNPPGVDTATRQRTLDQLNSLNRERLSQVGDPEIATRMVQYKLAFRMQSSVPELLDVPEPKHVLDSYGPDVHRPGSYAANCLLARRSGGRDVRFVPLFHMGWDHHGLPKAVAGQCKDTDQNCRTAERPRATRVVEGYAGGGRRVRAHGVFAGQFIRNQLRARSSSALFLPYSWPARAFAAA